MGLRHREMLKREQVHWLVAWYREQHSVNPFAAALDAYDRDLEGAFIDATGHELSLTTWKSRIREAARDLGLTGVRVYNACASPGAGIPRYSVVYS